jgi:hypothetical protein
MPARTSFFRTLSSKLKLRRSEYCKSTAAVRFGGVGHRYILVAFEDRTVGLLSHADGTGPLARGSPETH